MMKVKGIFAVSFIAMMVVGGAYANIASQGYVDQQIGTRQVAGDYATNTALGTVRTAATNAQSTATAAQSAAANAQKTADAKVSTAQGSSAANKAVITDASGDITTGTIASGMIAANAVTSAKIADGTIVNADIASNAAIAQSKISGLTTALAGKANTADVPTKTSDLTNDSGFITAEELPDEYTLPVATANALGGVKSGGDITVATSGAVTVNSATKATQDASGNVITSTYAKKTELSAKQNASTAVEVATAGTAVGDSTHPVYVNSSGVATKIDKVAAAAKADTATSATTATTATSATKATQDASGNVITTTYATKSELTNGLSGKQATLSGAQLNAVNSGITSAKVSTYDGYNAKITAAQNAADDAADAAAAAQTAANGKVTANAAITAGTATKITYDAKGLVTGGASLTASDIPTIPSTKVSGLGTLATKSAVTSAEITDGTITNADISASAAIAKTKLASDVRTSLGKADTAIQSDDLAQVATSGSYNDLTDKPTIPAAITVDSALSSTSTNPVQNKVINTALAGKLSTTGTAAKATADASGNNIADTYATKAQLTELDSTSSGSGAVVTKVSQTDGKVSVTKGNVQIPVGSATATTYATIWVQ